MTYINATVKDRDIVIEGSPVIVCNNNDYAIKFTFDDGWKDHDIKTARFVVVSNNKSSHTDVVFVGDTAPVPVMCDITSVYVGVFAGDIKATSKAYIPCKKSILCDLPAVPPPTPDCYEQILALFEDVHGASCYFRFSEHEDGTDFTEEWHEGQEYIGFATSLTPPTEKEAYIWARIMQGEPGNPGVYVGTDEPPEDANVWVNPDGDMLGSLNTVIMSDLGNASGFGTMTIPCKTYIKDELFLNYANGKLIFEWYKEGDIVAEDGAPREAIVAYRYWCTDIGNYSYEHLVTSSFPVSIPTDHIVDVSRMEVLFAGILAVDGEEMDDTDTADSFTAPMASGFVCFSCGKGSYSGGYLSTAWKPSSLAYGYKCLAFGDNGIALGSAQVLVDKGIAIGQGVVAKSCRGQVVLGRFNVIDEKGEYAFIFGNGTDWPSINRSNAITMKRNGDTWFAGKLSVENQAVTADNDLTPKSYVDDVVSKAAGTLSQRNCFIQGVVGEENVIYKTSPDAWWTIARFDEGEVPNIEKQGVGHGSYLVEHVEQPDGAPIFVSAKHSGIDCSDTELLGIWIKYEPTATEGETSVAHLRIEVTSSGKADAEEITYQIALAPSGNAQKLKEGWNFYKLDLNTDSSVPAKFGAAKNTSKLGVCDISKINFLRVYGKSAYCKIHIGQCAKIAKAANDEFVYRDFESMLTLDASGKVTAICGHSIA